MLIGAIITTWHARRLSVRPSTRGQRSLFTLCRGYYRVNICRTILSKTHFYFTAGIVDTMLKKREEREEQRLR